MLPVFSDTLDIPDRTKVEDSGFKPRIELTGKLGYSSKKGGSRNIGRIGFVLPVFQKMDSVLFLSLIGMQDTAKHIEGNFGLGFRKLVNSRWILGGYGFYDLRKTQNNNLLSQATFGVEALSKDIEFRSNIYVPFGIAYELGENNIYRVNYNPNTRVANLNVSANKTVEKALAGFDIEAGGNIPGIDRFELFGGYYYFFGKDVETIKG
ncbi:MAG: inverse autotransporter beta domain-containing protein, partial [Legionellales bacterium]|nr:inverse autotransporter beta domain-containing protein [Legionellales bacterium]